MGRHLFTESLYQDLAGNMVSTPVMLAAVMATLASLSWSEEEPEEQRIAHAQPQVQATGHAHGDNGSELAPSTSPPSSPSADEDAMTLDEEEELPATVTLKGGMSCRKLYAPGELEFPGQCD